MDIESRIKSIADEIRSYEAIALLGAGISLGQGFPLTSQLQMLLWNAIDSDESALRKLTSELGEKVSPAKILIGDDRYKTDLALNVLASSSVARKTFQYSFKKLNDNKIKNPSEIHDIISELMHRRTIKMVISLNWDTLLETAYHRHYGGIIYPNGDWFKKPHGDASNPDLNWVLPNEVSDLPDEIIQEITSLAKEHPRVLLIIGYSENDEEIVSKIIEPLSDQWRVVRIGPHVTDEHSIPLNAENALPILYKHLYNYPEVPGCEYINFNNQHDLSYALNGIGLAPADVDVCPRLPEVDVAKQQLEIAGSSVIMGGMGSGKSLISYQTANDLNKDGWEILRLQKITQTKEMFIENLLNLPCKSMLIIDNAQTFDKDYISYILENASSNELRILITTTDDNISRYNKIRVASENAVSVIAENFKNRQKEILPLIQKFDKGIGEGYTETPLEHRINHATQNSKSPWQFNFILTAGWNRADSEMRSLRENERFDLLLAAISIKQILSMDTGSSFGWLEKAALFLGKDKNWMHNAIDEFKNRHLIVEGNKIRCPHVRFSEVVLDIIYKNRKDEYHQQLIDLFRMSLNEEIHSLKGIYWVLSSRFSSETSSYLFESILDSPTLKAIINRCWSATSNEDINYAAKVITILLRWYPDLVQECASNSKLMSKWIEIADARSVHGLGELLNSLGQIDHSLTEFIIGQVDPKIIANKLAEIRISDAYVWGYFLGRLVFAGSHEWLTQLNDSLDSSSLERLFLNVDVNAYDISSIDELAEGIVCLDDSLAIKLVDLANPKIASAINKNIVKFPDITHIIWFVLGFAPDVLRQDKPSEYQKQVAYKLSENINAEELAYFISNSHRRDWKNFKDLLAFLNEVMPEKVNQISQLIDFNALDKTTAGLWENQPPELIDLISALLTKDNERLKSWIARHSEEFVNLHPLLVVISPESAINLLNQGYNLNLYIELSCNWTLATMTITNLSRVDKELASKVLVNNKNEIAQGFELKRDNCIYECFPDFINLMKDLTPDVLNECLESLDSISISNSWAKRLDGDEGEQCAVETLIKLVIDENITSLISIAQELKKKLY